MITARKDGGTRSRTAVVLALAIALLVAGCGARSTPIGLDIGSRTSFERDWQRYARVRASKAFAYAGDPAGLSVTGMAYGMPSKVEAETRALDYCEEQRLARGVVPPCVIFAVDSDVIQASADGAAPPPLRGARDLSALF